MPVKRHYKGHGDEVMASMRKTYGDTETAKRVFYATENKQKQRAKSSRKRSSRK